MRYAEAVEWVGIIAVVVIFFLLSKWSPGGG